MIEFEVGQIYGFKSRAQDPDPKVYIVKLDDGGPKGQIVHTHIKGLKIKTPLSKSGFTDHIVHLPFTESALENSSLIYLETTKELPDISTGYQSWLKGFEDKKAGIFHIPLIDAINFIEERMN